MTSTRVTSRAGMGSAGRMVAEARRRQRLVNETAVYRLDFVMRSFATLAVAGLAWDLLVDYRLPGTARSLGVARLGFGGDSTFVVWTLLSCVHQALWLFLLYGFWRATRQIERGEARELLDGLPVLPRVYVAILVTDIVMAPAAASALPQTGPFAWRVTLLSVAFLAGLTAIMRVHVRKAAVPLAARAAVQSPARTRYLRLPYAFLLALAASAGMIAGGYVIQSSAAHADTGPSNVSRP